MVENFSSNKDYQLIIKAKKYTESLPSPYGQIVPVFTCEVKDRISRGEKHFNNYIAQVIWGRFTHVTAINLFKLNYYVKAYLLGEKEKNPLIIFSTTRSTVEFAASVYYLSKKLKDIRENGKITIHEKVELYDRSLIKYQYGNRNNMLEQIKKAVGNKFEYNKDDEEDWKSINILTSIETMSKDQKFLDIRRIYDELCEFVHPNMANNYLINSYNLVMGKAVIAYYARESDLVTNYSLKKTLPVMARCIDYIIKETNNDENIADFMKKNPPILQKNIPVKD